MSATCCRLATRLTRLDCLHSIRIWLHNVCTNQYDKRVQVRNPSFHVSPTSFSAAASSCRTTSSRSNQNWSCPRHPGRRRRPRHARPPESSPTYRRLKGKQAMRTTDIKGPWLGTGICLDLTRMHQYRFIWLQHYNYINTNFHLQWSAHSNKYGG